MDLKMQAIESNVKQTEKQRIDVGKIMSMLKIRPPDLGRPTTVIGCTHLSGASGGSRAAGGSPEAVPLSGSGVDVGRQGERMRHDAEGCRMVMCPQAKKRSAGGERNVDRRGCRPAGGSVERILISGGSVHVGRAPI